MALVLLQCFLQDQQLLVDCMKQQFNQCSQSPAIILLSDSDVTYSFFSFAFPDLMCVP